MGDAQGPTESWVSGACVVDVGVGVSLPGAFGELPGYFEELPGYLYFRVPFGTTADLPKSPQPQPLFFLVMAQPIGHPLVCVRVHFGRWSPWWGAWERGENDRAAISHSSQCCTFVVRRGPCTLGLGVLSIVWVGMGQVPPV